MESLPTEIDLQIWAYLSLIELSLLSQCSKTIQNSLDPYLLSPPFGLGVLMHWGCAHGDRFLLQKAISYGADVSSIEVSEIDPKHPDSQPSSIWKLSTLAIVAEQHDPTTFRFLLDHGARLDPLIFNDSRWKSLSSFLFSPQHVELLNQCINNGLKRSPKYSHENLDKSIFEAARPSAGLMSYHTWSFEDVGPSISLSRDASDNGVESAAATAVLSGSISIARFLASFAPVWCNKSLESILDIYYGPSWLGALLFAPTALPNPLRRLSGWPILAAAHHMASSGTTCMLDVLLESNFDINKKVEDFPFLVPGFFQDQYPQGLDALFVYTLSVDCNKESKPGTLSPSQGLQYLFDKGARIKHYKWASLYDLRLGSLLPLYQYFWRKWGCLEGLLNDEVYSMLKMMASWGPHTMMGIQKHLQICKLGRCKPEPVFSPNQQQVIVTRWAAIMDVLLRFKRREYRDREESSESLFELLMNTMERTLSLDLDSPEINSASSLLARMKTSSMDLRYPITIQKLIQKGADLTWRSESYEYEGASIVEAVSRRFKKDIATNTIRYKLQQSFVAGLVKLGAEPLENGVSLDGRKDHKDKHIKFRSGFDSLYEKSLEDTGGRVLEDEDSLWSLDGVSLLSLPRSCFPSKRRRESTPLQIQDQSSCS